MKKKVLVIILNLLVITWLIILQSTKVSATLGNAESIVYSSDNFDGEKNYAVSLKKIMENSGKNALIFERPKSVYGINSILSNSDCTYISAKGLTDGSIITLDKNYVYYRPDDVIKGMSGNLAFLSVCYGAKTDKVSGENLCTTLMNCGYRAVIGYESQIGVEEARAFEKEFFNNWMIDKKTLTNAFCSAKDYTSSRYGSNNPVSTSVRYFGNGALKH
ncbi:MAG: hypothetical protein PUB17_04620 [Lachnospiraceae bacterium]|nr:hypothetical protein [Lachnospiraceae bacterium]